MAAIPIVREFMVTTLVSLRPEMNISEAIHILLKNKISGAPVVNEEEELVGVLSERDCLRLFAVGAFDPSPGGSVSMYMSSEVLSVTPDDDLFKVAEIFLNNSFRRLPVLENNKVIGQVSRRDVLLVSKDILEDSPVKKEWTDATYLTDEIKAALTSPSDTHSEEENSKS